jgi:hypothetical protein
MLLLTDGCVFAQDSGTSRWWRLKPDGAGRYANGQWQQAASSHTAPLYFASAVLRDGTVFIAGGEYSNNGKTAVDLCSAELYDPVDDLWIGLSTPPGWTAIGDAPCCVLPDGTVLVGNINTPACAIFDPVSRAWSATAGDKLNPSSSEESWTLLPDGSVLTAVCDGHPASERFSGGVWLANGATAGDLVEAASREIGPAILLPGGSVFATGATGLTALFVPDPGPALTGTWVARAPFPTVSGRQLGAKDAPACLLANGRVLCAAGPVDGQQNTYSGPTYFLEYDPAANTWAGPLPSPPGDAGLPPYQGRFLLLPTGEVLYSNSTPTLQTYRPDGAADAAWQPAIIACPEVFTAGTVQRLTGIRLNGLSQACAYGDDAAMATNYPLVRLRAAAPGNAVIYGRTRDHSTMGVATGGRPQSTDFMVPADTPAGSYQLEVVANGIASAPRTVNIVSSSVRKSVANGGEAANQAFGDQDEMFRRDLFEVHLLMDFVSGRSDKSLTALTGLPRIGLDGSLVEPAKGEVVKDVCLIQYPPAGGPIANATQAALLLAVKDQLNEIAEPARGMTIAYTAMFSGVAATGGTAPRKRSGGILADPKQVYRGPSSASLAYPPLEGHAQRFAQLYRNVPWAAFVAILLVVWINWDVSVTSSALQQVVKADADYDALFAPDRTFRPFASACPQPNEKPVEAALCDRARVLERQRVQSRDDLAALFPPGLSSRPIAWAVKSSGIDTKPAPPCDCKPGYPEVPSTSLQNFVIAVVGTYTTIIVPALFGFLGTLAGLVRSVAAKVADSVLAPRDYMLFYTSVALGLVAGMAVGLFFNGSDAAGSEAKSFGISITAAGLSFLAGYAADSFFTMMDGLKARLFSATPRGGTTPAK